MKCERCKSETIVNRQRYNYTECGLDNIYLENIEVRVCPACGLESPRIPHINELHDTIGRAIALQYAPLSGQEARFLRKHLGLKAREWAEYLRVDATTLSRWENEEQQIGAQSEALIRMLYSYLMFKKAGRPMLDGLAEAIAAVAPGTRAEIPAVLVNPRNPERYSYHSRAELAC
jgi:putative zinc finger/helix-turn-helix YgiT family protein